MKVLIIEDDPPSRRFLMDTVISQGHDVEMAENGMVGLKLFKEFKPDLIFSDIKMPKMDGLELLQEIRKIDKKVIVIMNTAFGCEEYAVKALRLQASNYLKKPMRQKELLPLLKKYTAMVESNKPRKEEPPVPGSSTKYTLKVENDVEMIPRVVDLLVFKSGDNLEEEDKLDVKLGLTELLTNAIEHGNLEISREELVVFAEQGEYGKNKVHQNRLSDPTLAQRKVTVNFMANDRVCEWIIADQGKGFDHKTIMKEYEQGNLPQMDSKGIYICKFHFDSLQYAGNGNRVKATKNRRN